MMTSRKPEQSALNEEIYKQLLDPSPIIQYYYNIRPLKKENLTRD